MSITIDKGATGQIGILPMATIDKLDDSINTVNDTISTVESKFDSITDEIIKENNTLKQRQRKHERAQKKFDEGIKASIDRVDTRLVDNCNLLTRNLNNVDHAHEVAEARLWDAINGINTMLKIFAAVDGAALIALIILFILTLGR